MNESKVEVEEAVTSGCPSMGLPRIPSGADGTEPLVRTDYESIIAYVFHKCNEAFINAPQQLEARPGYFKVFVGDLADALASVVPFDNRGRDVPVASNNDGASADDATRTSRPHENVIYRTPQHIVDFIYETCNIPFADQAEPDFLKNVSEKFKLVPVEESKSKVEVEERNEKSLALHDVRGFVAKTPSTVVMNFTLTSGRRISAEIHDESTTSEAEAELFDGDNIVCRIRFFNQYQGRNWTYPIIRRALNGLLSKAGKKCRNRYNKKNV